MNQQGVIDVEATRLGDDSSLKEMIRLVEEAEKNKAPIVRLAEGGREFSFRSPSAARC